MSSGEDSIERKERDGLDLFLIPFDDYSGGRKPWELARSNPCLSVCACVCVFPSLYCSTPGPRDPAGWIWIVQTQKHTQSSSSTLPSHFNITHLHSGRVKSCFLPENIPPPPHTQSTSSSTRDGQPKLSQQTETDTDTNTNTRRSACLFIMSGFNELQAALPTRGAPVRGHRGLGLSYPLPSRLISVPCSQTERERECTGFFNDFFF